MNRLKSSARYLLLNFGPLIAFYLVNQFWGLKAAILGSLAVTIIEIGRLVLRKEKPTVFFVFSAVIAVVFGTADLLLDSPLFFRFEPALINLLFAGFFALSLFREKSLVQELAEQQGRADGKDPADKAFFFRFLTFAWVVYFMAKATAYTWMGLHVSLEQGLALRLILGKLSFLAMMAFSIGLARPIWKLFLRLRLMPSTRVVVEPS